MVLQQLDHQRIPSLPCGQHHMRLDDLAALLVGGPDHGAFQHGRMGQQRRLYLGPGDVVAGADDHVVGPGGKVEAPLVVLPEAVAGQVPAVPHIGALPVIGHIAAAGRAAHGQPAHLAAWQVGHVRADDPRLIAGDGAAGAAGAVVVKAVGQEDVQHLGRADAVQHRLAGLAIHSS